MPAPTRALPVRPIRRAGPLAPARYRQERRTVVFEGTAIETGTWMPTLGVLVTEGDSSVFEAGASTDGLCRTRREATYAFTVAPP